MVKKLKTELRAKVNKFTTLLGDFIKETDWTMGTETVTINPKKLANTKITIQFGIRESVLDEIKLKIEGQRTLT